MKNRRSVRSLTWLLLLAMLLTSLPFATVSASGDDIQYTDVENEAGSALDIFDELEGEVTDVASSDELAAALAENARIIRITESFALDRTFYVTSDTAIYSESAVVLSRDAAFGGDLFVVGEFADGTFCESKVTLTLGNPASTAKDMLTIDGNKANMTATVVGSALFVTKKGIVDVFVNVNFTNHKKVGNERTLTEKYTVSYPVRVGGSVAIVEEKAEMNIYGGTFSGNEVNTVADDVNTCIQGGAFYNYGTMYIYGGTFEGNQSSMGGVFFNYRKIYIYCATIRNNTAKDLGGAIYMPNSTGAFTYIGGENEISESAVTFSGNSATDGGGAIYARNYLSIKNAVFTENHSSDTGGAICAYTPRMTIESSYFTDNTASTHGAAIAVSNSNGKEDVAELTVKACVFEGNASTKYGGAIYMVDCRVSMTECDIASNSGSYGGAFYADGATLEIDDANIYENSATSSGGTLYSLGGSTIVLNEVYGYKNTAKDGGFLYSKNTSLTVFNSVFEENEARTAASGAFALYEAAATQVYGSTFKNNTAATNAGAVTMYTGNTVDVVFNNCVFEGNTSSNYGGAFHISGKTQAYLYAITAKNNTAKYGGFMYETAAGTVVTVGGLTVSGNTAPNGPTIWGNTLNADMYLDKGKYLDLDVSDDWDDAYWAATIANKLTVVEKLVTVPSYVDYDESTVYPVIPAVPSEVSTSAELERALAAGLTEICIKESFEIDRTFYIVSDVVIYSKKAVVLTRAADFGGDIFVVGEDKNGTLCEGEVVLSFGKADAETADLLTVDGNKANVTASVVGSVFFVTKQGIVNVYGDTAVVNNKKVGNEKTLTEDYGVSYPARVGGSVAIVAASAEMNIYGGRFANNEINLVSDENNTCIQGAVIYNYGLLNIYGGTFDGNQGYMGGVFFNYRKMYIYNAVISNNTAKDLGGAIYMPNSTGSFTYIGHENDIVTPSVSFTGNTSSDLGGAIYAKNYISVKNATFTGNATTAASGGAIAATTLRMRIENCVFRENTAKKYGGALYVATENGRDEKECEMINCLFESNTSGSYGGAFYLNDEAVAYAKNVDFLSNQGSYGGAFFVNNSAVFELNGSDIKQNKSTSSGGAVYTQLGGSVTMNDIYGYANYAGSGGGFLYSEGGSLSLYNSVLEANSAKAASGALAFYEGASANVYATLFKDNTAGTNAGAVTAYAGNATALMFHGCTFEGNSSSNFGGAFHVSGKSQLTLYDTVAKNNTALYGGFMYETSAGTVATIGKLTVSGNSATNGPIIWGNTLNAKMYLDKAQYTDLDHTGSYDEAYWKTAIQNKLTVTEQAVSTPKYLDYGNEPYDHMADAVDVKNADELEAAILAGHKHIRIVADFEIDRTFYIVNETVIFSTIERRLTRAKDFAGDFFVVGENAEGVSAVMLGTNANLTLGNPLSVKESLLTIDGNRDAMELDVTGSILFICYGATVSLYDNVTVENCEKVGNVKALDECYKMTTNWRAGGPLALVANGTLNIYGGLYRNNASKDADTSEEAGEAGYNSTYGGLIYNRSNTTIYGGTFEGNFSYRGGVIYNYLVTTVYGGTFRENTASNGGGAIYCPSTSSGHLWIGSAAESADKVLFEKNTAVASNGGAIYSSYLNSFVIYGNTEFIENSSIKGSGGAIVTYGDLTARDIVFRGNTAYNRGGAVYAVNGYRLDIPRYVLFDGCTFEGNKALLGGAIQGYASGSDYESGAIITINDCDFISNEALHQNGSSNGNGGTIHCDRKCVVTINNSTITNSKATGEGGAIYAIGLSTITMNDSTITDSYADDKGGAISARSVYFNMYGCTVEGSTSGTNGGAVYVAYSSSYDINTFFVAKDTTFKNNTALGYGGAIYATRHTVTEEHRIVDLENVTFEGNSADNAGGAITLMAKSMVYMKDVTFKDNASVSSHAGALYASGAILEIDGAVMSGNTAKKAGGALYLENGADVILNDITANGNAGKTAGGFLYSEGATLKIYNSTLTNNTTATSGGAVALYDNAVTEIYNTAFVGNACDASGGALMIYTDDADGVKTVLNGCTFTGNSGTSGGAIYISNSSIVDLYNITAKENSAEKGGFLYVTVTGSVVTLNGATVNGNTASAGGSIIWGNSTGAKLYINKANYKDELVEVLDESYWSGAIANSLKVYESTDAIPTYKDYLEKEEPEEEEVPAKKPIPVAPIFELAEKASNASINSTYDKFPKLNNNSNFVSRNETEFENINGETVTVDTFVYPTHAVADNMNVGQGLLIYQAMLYKQAFPEEEVYIDASSYRFSVQAAVNINRESRYFGYMRQLIGVEYDQYGFVRIAYLLVCAAKMGIHVNVIPHIDGYPLDLTEQNVYDYFTMRLDEPCDPAYVSESGKTVGDYLDFNQIYWSLGEKGGTDMMHTKLCAVSHYLDMNGEVHRNAVFTSSSNLDGIRADGQNANWKLQTATIISDHEAIYRTSVNYLRLMAKYSDQEGIYEFQDIMSRVTAEQAQLILAGRANEIPADEQLIYLGTETDDVFELYFTPFGGSSMVWDEVNNPYCKYMRKLYDSEDYIFFAWNAAEYNGNYMLGRQLEEMLIAAFHENRNPMNRVYGYMENFDSTAFDDLVVGVDIGYKSFNVKYFGSVHNKDIHMSYVENGQRYYVSILNSLNQHGGSMYYQSNFALVIKEKTCSEDSVYYTVTKYSVDCEMVEHTYGEEVYTDPVTETVHGSRYHTCDICGDRREIEVLHNAGEWIVLREAGPGKNGMRYKRCTVCNELLATEELIMEENNGYNGMRFEQGTVHLMEGTLPSVPRTIEAIVNVPSTMTEAAGVIFGNYGKNGDYISMEVAANGNVVLRVSNGGITSSGSFKTDIRSDEPQHITVLVRDNNVARMFFNGEYISSLQLNSSLPEITEGFAIGGDFREGNTNYFKGTLYSLAFYDDVRSMVEIAEDTKYVSPDESGLMFMSTFSSERTESYLVGEQLDSISFTTNEVMEIAPAIETMPRTFEALIRVNGDPSARLGAVISNYGRDPNNAVSIEIYTGGRVRFFTISNGVRSDCIFDANVLSDKPVHIALSVEGKLVSLYINGEYSQTLEMAAELPTEVENFAIGGDYRGGNTQCFKGNVYSVHLFDGARTAEEIKSDVAAVPANEASVLYSAYAFGAKELSAFYGQTFSENVFGKTDCALSAAPLTFEAVVQLPTSFTGRGGVIIGNHAIAEEQINLEIYTGGKVRLYYMEDGVKSNCYFNSDIRSDKPVHIAVTMEGKLASLYINGELADQQMMSRALPNTTTGYIIGGDARPGNVQYFRGTIYSVALYDTVRTAEQIRADMVYTSEKDALFAANFMREEAKTVADSTCHGSEQLFIERALSADSCGLLSYRCADCGEILRYAEYTGDVGSRVLYDQSADALTAEKIETQFASTPKTFEFLYRLTSLSSLRAGTILGNYDGSGADQLNIEVYTDGQLRLYYKTDGVAYKTLFTTDIRSDVTRHMAVVIDGAKAHLYLDGVHKETVTLEAEISDSCNSFCVGMDNRATDPQYFTGELYAVHIFDDIRTAEEIAQDVNGVITTEEGLVYANSRVNN